MCSPTNLEIGLLIRFCCIQVCLDWKMHTCSTHHMQSVHRKCWLWCMRAIIICVFIVIFFKDMAVCFSFLYVVLSLCLCSLVTVEYREHLMQRSTVISQKISYQKISLCFLMGMMNFYYIWQNWISTFA